ncbi:fibropellin-1-like [Mya arenaria]|uniref:fibropellin-1-like n=1 Tax=Mya arenaria TaxID=6604 RepID=UPI0022E2E25B|nr:fibropellin-1-like [Mya arenaria]
MTSQAPFYTCACAASRTGTHCELDQCLHQSCQNNGTCRSIAQSPFYACDCRVGYYGHTCQHSHCDKSPCQHGACAVTTSAPFYSCSCTLGYSGYNCSVDPCQTHSCQNGGQCSVTSQSPFYECACSTEYYGINCEHDHCGTNPCQHYGTCAVSSINPFYTCSCTPGHFGHNCDATNCDNSPCHHGICTVTTAAPFYHCACRPGYSGQNCTESACKSYPCHHGGTCRVQGHTPMYTCSCRPGYTGTNCQDTHCRSSPCQNNGKCHMTASSPYYSCACPVGYNGASCETRVPVTVNINDTGDSLCLACDNVVSPHSCDRLSLCGSHESCFIDTFVNSLGSIRYNLGCRDSIQCATAGKRSDATLEGRTLSARSAVVCSQCCRGKLCNSGGCGLETYFEGPYVDRGPICFKCSQQNGVDDCDSVEICSRDQICQLKISGMVDTQTIWESTCIDHQSCFNGLNEVLGNSNTPIDVDPPVIGKRDVINATTSGHPCKMACCDTDLCNRYCPDV